jgi:hypothetical protein
MKKLITTFIFLNLSTASFASIDQTKYSNVLKDIKQDEQSKNFKVAALKAAGIANQIAAESHFDELIKTMTTALHENREEVITDTSSDHAGFNIFGLISGSVYKKYDTAKILTTNPEEVQNFSRKAAKDFDRLQKELNKYIKKHETEIFYAKVFSAKSLELTAKISSRDIPQIYNYVTQTAQKMSTVSFSGVQNILKCTSTDYAERSTGEGIKLKILFSSLNLSTKKEHMAYSETICDSTSSTIESSEVISQSTSLMFADETLESAEDTLALKMLEAKAPSFPTWGSPYLL